MDIVGKELMRCSSNNDAFVPLTLLSSRLLVPILGMRLVDLEISVDDSVLEQSTILLFKGVQAWEKLIMTSSQEPCIIRWTYLV